MSASHSVDFFEDTLARSDAADSLVKHLDSVRDVVEVACGRGFAHEVDDCFAWVLVRLIENDYARIRRHRGSSPLRYYLRTVVIHLVRDYRVSIWGKWSPSEAARRLGMTAMRLERLVWRDGHSGDDAVSIVAQREGKTHDELHRLLGQVPTRSPRRFVDAAFAEGLESTGDVESRVVASRQAVLEGNLKRHLKEILAEFDPETRQLLRRHFRNGESIAAIARGAGANSSTYYSWLTRCLKKIRSKLLARGIEGSALEELRWQKLELSLTSLLADSRSGGS